MLPATPLEYIVNEIVRRYGKLPPRFIANLRRNVRRNYHVSISAAQLEQYIPLYRGMYKTVAAAIHAAPSPTTTPPIEDGERLAKEFGAQLTPRYPDQPRSIVDLVANWAVYYEIYR